MLPDEQTVLQWGYLPYCLLYVRLFSCHLKRMHSLCYSFVYVNVAVYGEYSATNTDRRVYLFGTGAIDQFFERHVD